MSLSSMLIGKPAASRRDWKALDLFHCGITGGVLAGSAYALAQAAMSGLQGRPLIEPLRLTASLVLGGTALDPESLSPPAVGLFVHLMISAFYGVVFLFLHWELKRHDETRERLILDGALFGFAIWVINFFVIAPRAYPQFLVLDPVWIGLVAHAFFFGAALGVYVGALQFSGEECERTETITQAAGE
jgi:hypothetical protein